MRLCGFLAELRLVFRGFGLSVLHNLHRGLTKHTQKVRSFADLLKQPKVLKRLVWQSINECQQKNWRLPGFEMMLPHRLEIKIIGEFVKTLTGKIRQDLYIQMGRQRLKIHTKSAS